MERLIEYVTHHPLMAAAAVLALVVVFTYESRVRASAFAAISSQDLIRLMNQGALVLDIRKPEEFAAGHVNGAKQLPSDQILTAGDNFKRFKEKPVVVYDESGLAGGRGGAPAQPAGIHQGVLAARRHSPAGARSTCRSPRRPDEHAGGRHVHHELVSLLRACAQAARSARGVTIERNRRRVGAREARRDAQPQRPDVGAADFHRRPARGWQRRSAALESAGKLDGLLGR